MARNNGKAPGTGPAPGAGRRKRARLATFTTLHDGVVKLGEHVHESGYDPAYVLIQIPSEMGAKLEEEMQRDFGWRDRCDGIALTADGHRKEIDLYGIRVYWKAMPRPDPW